MQNYHIITVRHVWSKRNDSPMVRIHSHRFRATKFIPYDNEAGSGSPSLDSAERWLKSKGFNIIGRGEVKDDYILISDTFQSL